ncbi:PAS domain S-box protein, partial [candidate division KSB3 bacterium]|nr:PAS domain S-box protein [candidate division KSB3 bacterium]MBD3325758.1 PAS domain S-box protein [candidate division KSB3 bacterium]
MAAYDDLRRKAEENCHSLQPLPPDTPEQTKEFVYELQVHQIELEMQREQLLETQRQLEASQQKYRDLYDCAPVGYCSLTQEGEIVEANLTLAKLLERDRDALLNTRIYHYIVEEDRDIMYRYLHQTFQLGYAHTDEVRVKTASGRRFYVHVHTLLEAEECEPRKFCRLTLTNVTRLKKLEQKLQFLSRVFLESDDPMLILDLQGHIIELNAAVEQAYGWTREELLGYHLSSLVPSTHRESISVLITRCKHGEKVQNVESLRTTRSGQPLPVLMNLSLLTDDSGEPIAMISVAKHLEQFNQEIQKLQRHQEHLRGVVEETSEQLLRVIGQREQAQHSLEASEQQFRFLADQFGDGIEIIRDGQILFANTALAAMFGYPQEDLPGMDAIALFREEYRDEFTRLLDQQMAGDGQTARFEAVGLTHEGNEIWIEDHLSRIEWEGDVAILLVLRDITIQKHREFALEEERQRLNRTLTSSLQERYRFGNIIGKTPVMQDLYKQILAASASEANVYIFGESGVGKEMVAHTIHQLSRRSEQPFVTVNCGAITETLFESEFFGYRKGAFTGADRDKRGLLAAAHQGTLFLDEVGELTSQMQVKLLRALETGEYTPVGDTTSRIADIRIVAATNRELQANEEIRVDFFYRINVMRINVPPLRERKEDIPLLVEHFLRHYASNDDEHEDVPSLPAKLLETFAAYEWPGNVRELQNIVQRYLAGQPLDFIAQADAKLTELSDQDLQQAKDLRNAVEHFEKTFILSMLEHHHWQKSKTADA